MWITNTQNVDNQHTNRLESVLHLRVIRKTANIKREKKEEKQLIKDKNKQEEEKEKIRKRKKKEKTSKRKEDTGAEITKPRRHSSLRGHGR